MYYTLSCGMRFITIVINVVKVLSSSFSGFEELLRQSFSLIKSADRNDRIGWSPIDATNFLYLLKTKL